ncbi:MAG TPA: histidine phosphatase family protein [Candidatus Saccharimonadia bacterium]|nr:histidine phosphatase family protein [Candidatus Saccharimonadia bacterium]
MRVFFVRHGQTLANLQHSSSSWNHDSPLTEDGRGQVKLAAELLRASFERPVKIIASPLLRTRQTADILASQLNTGPVLVDDRLKEANVGYWGQRTVDDVNDDFRKLSTAERPTLRPPHGETWLEIGSRVAQLVEEMSAGPSLTLVLVSHDAPIRFGVGTLLHEDSVKWSDRKFPTGSISLLEASGNGWREVYIGKTQGNLR